MIARIGAERIRPMNHEIDVHSSAEKFKFLIFIDRYVSPWYLELRKSLLRLTKQRLKD